MQFLRPQEEVTIKRILVSLAQQYNLLAEEKESYQTEKSRYIDHLWSVRIGKEKVPIVSFEIEKGVPGNERIRKDIFNLLSTKTPMGYIILPHKRITASTSSDKMGVIKWYRKHFFKVFSNYYEPFRSFIDIRLLDSDDILDFKTLDKHLTLDSFLKE